MFWRHGELSFSNLDSRLPFISEEFSPSQIKIKIFVVLFFQCSFFMTIFYFLCIFDILFIFSHFVNYVLVCPLWHLQFVWLCVGAPLFIFSKWPSFLCYSIFHFNSFPEQCQLNFHICPLPVMPFSFIFCMPHVCLCAERERERERENMTVWV